MLVPFEILHQRVEQLEQGFSLTAQVIQTVMSRLQDQLGKDCLGPGLEQVRAAGDAAQTQEIITRIDDLLAKGNDNVAVRLHREMVGVTWDQALQAIGSWRGSPVKARLRAVMIGRFLKAASELHGSEADPGRNNPLQMAH
jgi:hypothetical protein